MTTIKRGNYPQKCFEKENTMINPFGDAGTATLVEKTRADPILTSSSTDGAGYKIVNGYPRDEKSGQQCYEL
jgi:hypothetical protein